VRLHMAAPKIILAISLVAWLPCLAFAMTPSQVYESVKDSVVVVKVYDWQGNQTGLASGVMLPSGDIVTNYHVVKAGVRFTVGRGKQATPATLKGGDPDKDLCLLTAPGVVAVPARLGKTAKLKVGDPVYAVGAPQGLELSLSEGIVSQLRGGGPHPIIQTTVAISPGSSGGGLFNAEGELVGITTFYRKTGQSLNFALPVEWIAEAAGNNIRERPIVEVPRAPAPEVRSQEDWKRQALALQKTQDWHGLLAWCHRWTQAEPGNAEAWVCLGVAYGTLGRHQEAINTCREALRLKPDFAEAHYFLGSSYDSLGRSQEAIASYKEAIRLKPDFAKAYLGLGSAYDSLGRYQEALLALKEAIRLKPDLAEAHAYLGMVYYKLGRYQELLAATQEAIRLKPDFAEAHAYLGVAYYKLGRSQEAIASYKEAIRLKPDFAKAHANLGEAYLREGNRVAALVEYKTLQKLNPELAEWLFKQIYP